MPPTGISGSTEGERMEEENRKREERGETRLELIEEEEERRSCLARGKRSLFRIAKVIGCDGVGLSIVIVERQDAMIRSFGSASGDDLVNRFLREHDAVGIGRASPEAAAGAEGSGAGFDGGGGDDGACEREEHGEEGGGKVGQDVDPVVAAAGCGGALAVYESKGCSKSGGNDVGGYHRASEVEDVGVVGSGVDVGSGDGGMSGEIGAMETPGFVRPGGTPGQSVGRACAGESEGGNDGAD